MAFPMNALLCLFLGAVTALANSDELAPTSRHRSLVTQAGGHFRNQNQRVLASGRGNQRHTIPEPDAVDADADDGSGDEQEADGGSGADGDDDSLEGWAKAPIDPDAAEELVGDSAPSTVGEVGEADGDEDDVGPVTAEAGGNDGTEAEDDLEKNLDALRGLKSLVVSANENSFRAIEAAKTWREQSAAALDQFPNIESSTDELKKRMLSGNEAIKKDVQGDPNIQDFLLKAAAGKVSTNESEPEAEPGVAGVTGESEMLASESSSGGGDDAGTGQGEDEEAASGVDDDESASVATGVK